MINESSPYLLQHARNPVDWYPWGPEALQEAQRLDKPILVSIGYAACHWCHVMERESFEDEATAAIMNEHFINIKIDREERPDLDHIYMDAVQAMTGSGGWPLNVFLTPDARPFYGGTYYPPAAVGNRPSWKDVLLGIAQAYRERKDEIIGQANSLTDHIKRSNDFGIEAASKLADDYETVFAPGNFKEATAKILASADTIDGGFGRAPKFPQSFAIRYLLHHYYFTKDEAALKQALLSLDRMIQGGIYDQLGGGFARYSTDTEWLAPHFEKMLYDNALLLTALSEAFQITGKESYARCIRETVDFLLREMRHEEGGFYSALDADSEGVEGKYYVWAKAEIEQLLGEEADLFCIYYGVTEAGNWEHSNILCIRQEPGVIAEHFGIPVAEMDKRLLAARQLLLEARSKRVKPGLDDKSILAWNALTATALLNAAAALNDEALKEAGLTCLQFIRNNLRQEAGGYYHTWKAGQARQPAFLDDYAFLIEAFCRAQELTGNKDWLEEARSLAEFVLEGFLEEEGGFFYYTHANQEDVIVRKKEVYDGALPSGNSVMALNLYYLGVVYDLPDWREHSLRLCARMMPVVRNYPLSFGNWACLCQALGRGVPEIAYVGIGHEQVRNEFLRIFTPLKIFQAAGESDNRFPLLANKPENLPVQLYLCRHYNCQQPVNELSAFIRLLENV